MKQNGGKIVKHRVEMMKQNRGKIEIKHRIKTYGVEMVKQKRGKITELKW